MATPIAAAANRHESLSSNASHEGGPERDRDPAGESEMDRDGDVADVLHRLRDLGNAPANGVEPSIHGPRPVHTIHVRRLELRTHDEREGDQPDEGVKSDSHRPRRETANSAIESGDRDERERPDEAHPHRARKRCRAEGGDDQSDRCSYERATDAPRLDAHPDIVAAGPQLRPRARRAGDEGDLPVEREAHGSCGRVIVALRGGWVDALGGL